MINGSSPKTFEIASVSDAIVILHDFFNRKEAIENPSTGETIQVDREVVNSCLNELYFDITNPKSLLRSFLASLSSCPIDFRKEVVRNVCFVGGGIEFIPNFEARFLKAIAGEFTVTTAAAAAAAADSSPTFRSLRPLLNEKEGCLGVVYPLPFSPGVFAWTATSVFGSTGALPIEQTVHQQAFLSSQKQDSARSKNVIRDFLSY